MAQRTPSVNTRTKSWRGPEGRGRISSWRSASRNGAASAVAHESAENRASHDRESTAKHDPTTASSKTLPTVAEPEPKPEPEPVELDEDTLQLLFAGAPVFTLGCADSISGGVDDDDQLVPTVTFPFDGPEMAGAGRGNVNEPMTDFADWGHQAFALATARNTNEQHIAHETPSMQSFIGTEPGTVGWEYFLMLPVGDSEKPSSSSDCTGPGGAISATEARGLDSDVRERGGGNSNIAKGSLRTIEAGYIVERLKEVGEIWWGRSSRRMQSGSGSRYNGMPDNHEREREQQQEGKDMPEGLEMYTHLFTHLLYPPSRITTEDFNDPYSIKVQILALIDTLSKKQVWLDFSNVEWRIKLGQILWGAQAVAREEEFESEVTNTPTTTTTTQESEKVWLLLQILLGCELAVRLEAFLVEDVTPEENQARLESLQRFREMGGKKVAWDILLARRWLDNVKIIDVNSPSKHEKKQEWSSFLAPPNLSSWFHTSNKPAEPESPASTIDGSDASSDPVKEYDAMLVPRQEARQVDGLIHFARGIKWPDLDALTSTLISRASYRTPASSLNGTPLSFTSTVSGSYFPPTTRPKRLRELSRKRSSMLTLPKVAGTGGWLSRSFLTGLVLPGEGLPHFLISTLLENDASAVNELGFNANLYGGFVYRDRCWWSRYCIVARVLADLDSAAECAGWVSVGVNPELPDGTVISDGWVDVMSLPSPEQQRGGRPAPRAEEPAKVSRRSDPCGRKHRKKQSTIMSTDFGIPRGAAADSRHEGAPTVAKLDGVIFTPSDDDESEFPTYDVSIRFKTLFLASLSTSLTFRLRHDVHFVAAFPCRPPIGMNKDVHPLHNSYAYRNLPPEELEEVQSTTEEKGVAVIETWCADEVVFAKAWCADRGFSAVVGRRGRTCLACCIREAWGLGCKVVLRVG